MNALSGAMALYGAALPAILYLNCFLLPTLFSCSLLVFFRTDLEFVDLRLDDFGGWLLS